MSSPSTHPPVRSARSRLATATVAALVVSTLTGPVSADHSEFGGSYVREWNSYAASAIFNAPSTAPSPGNPVGAGQPPYVGVLHMAMVQGAVYDAVNAISGTHQPYNEATGSAPANASLDAAVVTAASDILSNTTLRLPADTRAWIEVERQESIDEIDATTSDADLAAGIAAGHAAAGAMLTARSTDGRFVAFSHPERTGAGAWHPDPGQATDGAAWVGNVTPFSLSSPDQLRTAGPLRLSSPHYAAEYEEVRTLGARTGSTRTQAQTDLALFYVPNPIEIFNRTFRTIADDRNLSVADEARLFGMLNLAAADGLISCWNDKSHYSFWRPSSAIHAGDNDGNRFTVGDPDWLPLSSAPPPFGNPPYPDHPSGYNCASSSFMNAGAAFFGTDQFAFRVQRNPTSVMPFRDYTRFSDVVDDTIDSRVYLGIHFRTADVQAAWIGKKAAQWLDSHEFQPID